MANGIGTGDLRGFIKGRSSKFCEGSRIRQTHEEGRRIYRPKCCGNDNKDEDNSPKNLIDKRCLKFSHFFDIHIYIEREKAGELESEWVRDQHEYAVLIIWFLA